MSRPSGSKNKPKAPAAAAPATDEKEMVLEGGPTTVEWDDADDDTDDEDAEGSQSVGGQAITNDRLADVLEKIVDSSPIKKVPFSKFKPKSSFNPEGRKGRKLQCRFYQNGYPVQIDKLADEEIRLFNELQSLMKPTDVLKVGLITWLKVQNGGNMDLHLSYKNKSNDDKLALKSEFRHLTDMLTESLRKIKASGVE